jgi:hypothetical protein
LQGGCVDLNVGEGNSSSRTINYLRMFILSVSAKSVEAILKYKAGFALLFYILHITLDL